MIFQDGEEKRPRTADDAAGHRQAESGNRKKRKRQKGTGRGTDETASGSQGKMEKLKNRCFSILQTLFFRIE